LYRPDVPDSEGCKSSAHPFLYPDEMALAGRIVDWMGLWKGMVDWYIG